ncbi:MAG: S8 family serine peptidase [Bacteroidota bacterium]
MKLRRLLLIASLLWGGLLLAQPGKVLPPAKDVDKEYRKEYRDDIKDWRKENRKDKRDQWDIVIPPEEDIPVQQYDELPPANADNWGVRILLPEGLKSRISKECKHPVVLKVADTGIQESHRDLQNNRLAGTDYTTSNTVDDEGGHGTHVAGIVVANNFGICDPLVKAGLLRFKSVKVLDKRSGSFTWYANMFATERAEDKRFQESGVSVVYNSSLGGGTTDIDFVEEELEKSAALGVTFVAASGNNNGPVSYPGRSTYSITAASLDQNLLRSSFSNFGAQVTGAMPGRNITSTYIGGGYAMLSGPHLAFAIQAAPAKKGEAMLVPESVAYPPPI